MNLENLAVTQYGAFEFESFCVFDGVPLGANEDGIFVLEQGDDDDGLAIQSVVETHKTDFGASFQKRMRSAYLGGEFGGDLTLLVKTDDSERTYTISADDARMLQHSRKTGIGRDQKGRYWLFRLENTSGCDLSLDHMEVMPVILGRRPG